MPKPLELRKLVRILKKYGIKTLILPYALDDMIEKFDLPGNVFDR
jgi:hypothetical protein